MTTRTKAELLAENKQLRAHNELLNAAVSQDVTIKELSAKMDDDGSMNVQIVIGDRGISHPGIRVLAAAALSLLELDGTVPPNYRTAEMSGKLASGETYFVEVAACKSKNQTPHKLRMKAEAERDALKDEVARLNAEIARLQGTPS
jgi:cell division protein FtsB